jgi:DNA polymerase III subunit delta
MENLHLFTGENGFALRSELARWKKQFAAKHGPENLVQFPSSVPLSDLLDATATMPFIAEKRLVIVDGLPKISKEEFAALLEGMHPAVILLFVDPKPDKRLALVKEVKKAATAHEFPVLSPSELRGWIASTLKEQSATITPDAVQALLTIVGTDQSMLDQELAKLALLSGGAIEKHHVELAAVPSGSEVIWRLTDLLGSGKWAEALAFVRHAVDRGDDVYGLWSAVLYMLKNLVFVWAAVQSGERDDFAIAGAWGVPPMSVRSLKTLARSLSEEKLRSIVTFAIDSDIALKTGGYRFSAEHPEEVTALLEKTILACRS